MRNLWKRVKSALILAGLGSLGFVLVGLGLITWRVILQGELPGNGSEMLIGLANMGATGGLLGLFAAGGIAVVGTRAGRITRRGGFYAGLTVGALGGVALGLVTTSMPVVGLIAAAAFTGLLSGVVGLSLVSISERADQDGVLQSSDEQSRLGTG